MQKVETTIRLPENDVHRNRLKAKRDEYDQRLQQRLQQLQENDPDSIDRDPNLLPQEDRNLAYLALSVAMLNKLFEAGSINMEMEADMLALMEAVPAVFLRPDSDMLLRQVRVNIETYADSLIGMQILKKYERQLQL